MQLKQENTYGLILHKTIVIVKLNRPNKISDQIKTAMTNFPEENPFMI